MLGELEDGTGVLEGVCKHWLGKSRGQENKQCIERHSSRRTAKPNAERWWLYSLYTTKLLAEQRDRVAQSVGICSQRLSMPGHSSGDTIA